MLCIHTKYKYKPPSRWPSSFRLKGKPWHGVCNFISLCAREHFEGDFWNILPNVNVNSYELKLAFYITNNTEIGIQSKRFITVQRDVRTRIDNFF